MNNKGLNVVKTRSTSGLKVQVADIYNRLGLAWWVEVRTHSPRCLYYFGPFLTSGEAESALPGYVQDLELEQAEGIEALVRRCKPTQVTVSED
ncbi:DUF1816 domain-containing protein [Lyngbya confervoides]|uniref:DUF1816 domain-containing protein n=1 Tax=Lyngbya confervoides BDU141951 TaxID=1574623 RepID=A0ABD4T942_9CYAN|nr:DUF1816 domain-containing protein [Lyngbya confervoides]MCM1985003.1 DUF1816 domain-containing protein [Lyngbya confervoides BDU141951]